MAKKKTAKKKTATPMRGAKKSTVLGKDELASALTPKAQALMGDLVSTAITIDKDDLLTVAVSKAEEHMQSECKAEQKKQEAHRDKAEGLLQAAHKMCLKTATAAYAASAETARKGLASLGYTKLETRVSAQARTNCEHDDAKRYATYDVHVQIDEMDKHGRCTERVVSRNVIAKAPRAVVALLREREVELKKEDEAQAAAVDWKRRLCQMPQLERKYRARLAQERVASEAGGQALLEALVGNVAKDVLALPSL